MTFYYPYVGNKRKELDQLFDLLNNAMFDCPREKLRFIEPFGGSCAFSIALVDRKFTTHKRITISDSNRSLTYFCNNFYKDPERYIAETVKLNDSIQSKEQYLERVKQMVENPESIPLHLFYRTYYNIRCGMYPLNKKPPQYTSLRKNMTRLNDFFSKVTYHTRDYKDVMERVRNRPNCILFLDPPYIENSSTGFYTNPEIDWEYLYEYFKTCRCMFIMVVNVNIFMNMLFKEWLHSKYDKRYEMFKGKTAHHAIYTNIKCKV